MLRVLIIQTAVMTAAACCWFLVALLRRRNDVADVAWGIGFIIAASTAMGVTGAVTARSILIVVLVIVWGGRLAAHIGVRNAGKGEDPRYRKWREEWGEHAALRAFLQIFLLQQYLVLVVLAPVTYVLVQGGGSFTALDAAGLCVWVVGFVFEALGDYQLLRFVREPANKGRIMTSGLWKYSRHPNYFGEVTLWWGVFLIALSVPGGWMTVIGPVAITVLILGVSGIPMLEARYEGHAEFAEYRRRTSAFFPMPPKA
jgi:steroid 5-alpha reductase family enzyme